MNPGAPGLAHVVVIGASAGGLDAIQALLGHLPVGGNEVYVVAQHLSPDRPSQLVDLLKRCTRLTVVSAADAMPLQAGQLIVVPPNCDAIFADEGLKLVAPEPRFGPSPSIDRLLDSLASRWGERSVAVILSGTGSDGACGLRAVGASGGLTLVQSPKSARFDGMPRAAIALGGVDLTADPASLGAQLGRWFSLAADWPDQSEDETTPLLLNSAAAQLKQCTGVDFSQYKESTLRRQVQRRMAIRGIKSIQDYLSVLAVETSEGKALLQNLLVSVTAFFRNSDAFAALECHLQTLISSLQNGEQLRVWVPACATGEEAYSIGMTVSKAMGHPSNLSQRLKIFATDLDEQSLAVGRRGIYPINAAKTIPSPLLERFASKHNDTFEINKDLRSSIVFARHNVFEDPPFPNIDLISFRNALIYFTPPLQERVIDLFSFSLHTGGLLFLGVSESLGRTSGFSVVNPTHRIYERNRQGRSRSRITLAKSVQPTLLQHKPTRPSAASSEGVPEQHVQLLEALIRTLAPPCLVVDENHDLVEVIGDVSAYCKLPEGRLTSAAGAFLRDELQSEARALLLLVRADRSAANSGILQLPGVAKPIYLHAAPLQVGERCLTILSFLEDKDACLSDSSGLNTSDRDTAFAREIERLERELLSSQDSLRRSMADLEQVNEELEASSEELQASAEELQSSNEELEASNEELQATNEELGGLNQQLRTRSDELERLNNELENIQSSLSQGMVIVDRQLRITRFSPLAVRVFGLVDSDIGQPLIGVPTTVPLPGLRDALLAVVNGEVRNSIEASSEDVSYLAQIMPYTNRDGQCLGAIITLTDVSELVALRRAAEASLHEFESLADALDQVVWKCDHKRERFLYISGRIQMLTGWSPDDIYSNPKLLEMAIHHEDRAAVTAARNADQGSWNVTYRITTRHGSECTLQEIASVLEESHDHSIVGTLTDITEQSLIQQKTEVFAAGFHQLADIDHSAVALLNASLSVIFANQAFIAIADHTSNIHPGDAALAELQLCCSQPGSTPLPGQPTALRTLAQQVLHQGQAIRVPFGQIQRNGEELGGFELDLLPLGDTTPALGVMLRLLPS